MNIALAAELQHVPHALQNEECKHYAVPVITQLNAGMACRTISVCSVPDWPQTRSRYLLDFEVHVSFLTNPRSKSKASRHTT